MVVASVVVVVVVDFVVVDVVVVAVVVDSVVELVVVDEELVIDDVELETPGDGGVPSGFSKQASLLALVCGVLGTQIDAGKQIAR